MLSGRTLNSCNHIRYFDWLLQHSAAVKGTCHRAIFTLSSPPRDADAASQRKEYSDSCCSE